MIPTAIILAGGFGTRLQPLTEETPKPLLPIKGKPIVQHVIERLKRYGVQQIILSVGYKAEQLQNYFGDGSRLGVKLSYAIETEPLGTGGAVLQAAQKIQQPFFLVWGDNVMDVDYAAMHKAYLHDAPQITMALTPREDVEHFGVARLEGNKILQFVEKPRREEAPSNLINAGAFIIDPLCLKMLPMGKSSLEHDCFEKLAPLGEISAFIHEGQWFPTDTLEKYSKACLEFHPEIDLSSKKMILMDVDDTVCEPTQQISPRLAQQIQRIMEKGYQVAFISGTTAQDLQAMISSQLNGEHHLLGTTGTTYIHVKNGTKKQVYHYPLTIEEKKEIISALERLTAHFHLNPLTSKEDQLQDRESQITLSALGRNAPLAAKKAFDPEGKQRQEWLLWLQSLLPAHKYDIRIGGTTSLDITRKGLDKGWGIAEFARHQGMPLGEILFIGDKLYPGGNDYPAAKIVDCIAVNNPEETLRELRKLP